MNEAKVDFQCCVCNKQYLHTPTSKKREPYQCECGQHYEIVQLTNAWVMVIMNPEMKEVRK